MKTPKKNWLEWTVFACSLALVLTVAGLLINQHFGLGNRPADPQIQLGPVEPRDGYLPFP
jgi:hypothetical protein